VEIITMKIERYLTQHDAAVLSKLAEKLLNERQKSDAGERLIEIISTAILLPENVRKSNCVSLYSDVTYQRTDGGDNHSIRIVCPQDANQTLARVSVMSPIALAIIGRQVGSLVEVELPFSQVLFVKILDVTDLSSVLQVP
jgi:regulator of nucleoside diphosphate kinase